jgi:pimeloyl-ACP methyl ester carboxylesterase
MTSAPTAPAAAPLGHLVRGSGPGLLLAHGGTGGIDANYGPLLDGLAERYTVVGPDYPGSGRTPYDGRPLDFDRLADDLVATAVAAGQERFAIVGYSLGGALAVRIAARHPERVTALAVTATFARTNARMRLLTRVWRHHLTAEDRETAARWGVLTGAGAPWLEGLPESAVEEMVRASTTPVLPGAVAQVDLVDSVDVRADLPRVAAPALVVATLHDQLCTPAVTREVADGIPGAEYAELPSGHLPFLEAPGQWLTLLRTFLDRHVAA